MDCEPFRHYNQPKVISFPFFFSISNMKIVILISQNENNADFVAKVLSDSIYLQLGGLNKLLENSFLTFVFCPKNRV
ncbi:hypothetical protein AYI68_g1839 [Smittium mucronatum]|uniref:Uncharacterized protein n=1 Tax=Smittium mucronatum TaxID=133383 RepID=A0A1R0H495_9FUNG|nr:hypothetical protein AYI68_g1839 [Smittium mucronatum]